ncbi:MAG: winged helix DNA-binding domain-containing protein [Rikenellaceae bacterium]|nr:winged helix DNA-binding domain-containing protein [Rikenellaceae bacterium]
MLNARMLSQQLAAPRFDDPAEVVRWMGALQAQESRMFKWTVGIRMQNPSLLSVQRALDSGRLIRAHTLRPTWHVVPAEDFRWMASLNESKLSAGIYGWAKSGGILPGDIQSLAGKVEKTLEGSQLTRQEVTERLAEQVTDAGERIVSLYLSLGEIQGRICSGGEKGGKNTYMLADERIPRCISLSRDEALAEMAARYFRSHGPATLDDFVWWSGLGIIDAKKAVASLGSHIFREMSGGKEFLIHSDSPALSTAVPGKILHLLPPYDEYLISYKDRSHCIEERHKGFAFNSWGIFHPVILYNGRITGNWRKNSRKTGEPYHTSFFEGCRPAAKGLIAAAVERYSKFLAE